MILLLLPMLLTKHLLNAATWVVVTNVLGSVFAVMVFMVGRANTHVALAEQPAIP